ncbi:hypothetical protein WOLCODRAFT_81581, partial [Wolfiporia cocos MD-104 SS10]
PPSVQMKQFLDKWATHAQRALLMREVAPNRAQGCGRCNSARRHSPCASATTQELHQCMDCYHSVPSCARCVVNDHLTNPLHRIEQWDDEDQFWKHAALSDLGLVVWLGHNGRPCPQASDVRTLTVLHEHGIGSVEVQFCQCSQLSTPYPQAEPLQLIEFGLFPVTWTRPATVFTIQVMQDFHKLTLQAQISAHDFIMYLCKLSLLQDRYREFLTAQREFAFLQATKRAGVRPSTHLPARSLAVWCPTCPQPMMNMDPGWKEHPKEKQYLDTLFRTVDGNFHQNMHEKPSDPDDRPLTKGAAYFADEDDCAQFLTLAGNVTREESTCNKFGAMGYRGHWSRVSGTVGLICMRHMFVLPAGGIDLQKGERFANVDFTMLSGLQPWMDLLLHISGYDINCQYSINFDKWMAKAPDHLDQFVSIGSPHFPDTKHGVGKLHEQMHCALCHFLFSFYLLPGVGMMDGEAAERVWAVLNALGACTQEMSVGHRRDVINDHHSDMNVRRVHSLARDLATKHMKAVAQKADAVNHLERLEESANDSGFPLDTWRKEERSFLTRVVDVKQHKGLKNPYESRKVKVSSQLDLVMELKTCAKDANKSGVIRTIEEGIALQEMRISLLHEINSKLVSGQDADIVQDRKRQLWARLEEWEALHTRFITVVVESALETRAEPTSEAEGEGERTDVGLKRRSTESQSAETWVHQDQAAAVAELQSFSINLPSSYNSSLSTHPDFAKICSVERSLCEGQANDALYQVRTHLITKYAHRKRKEKVTGQKANAQANKNIRKQTELICRAAREYRRARDALLRLGMPKDDPTYRELREADLALFAMQADEMQLGDSRHSASWLWEDASFVKNVSDAALKSYMEEGVRVHWFRSRARCACLTEEVELLEEEMRRTVRFFLFQRQQWLRRVTEENQAGEHGYANYARKQAYHYMRLLRGCEIQFEAVISVVGAV